MEELVKLEHVCVSYKGHEAVHDFSLTMGSGEIVCLVGESGSGKTSVIRAIMGLLPGGGSVTSGAMHFDGKNLLSLSHEEWRKLRGKDISMIFQDSSAMMNPTRRIGAIFTEYLRTHENISKQQAWEKGAKMLGRMRLPEPENIMKSYPFQLSGGMQQRVGIAMGMSYEPKLLLADEPTSALDVTTQAQIVREMANLRKDYGTSILMVTHNLGVAAYLSDRIVVMKDGNIEDAGDREAILMHPTSEYTKRLLEAVPSMEGERYV